MSTNHNVKRSIFTSLSVGVCITLLFVIAEVISLPTFDTVKQRIEGVLYDLRFNAMLVSSDNIEKDRRYEAAQEQVIIVDIDEKSMRAEGRYPWPRYKVAELVERLFDKGAAVVVFDIFFAEKERNPVDEILLNSSDESLRAPLLELKQKVDSDFRFAQSLQKYDVVLGFLLTDNKEDSKGSALKTSVSASIDLQKSTRLRGADPDNTSFITRYSGAISNIDLLQSAAAGLGFINSAADEDGFIRRAALVMQYNGQLYPSIALEAARLYTMADNVDVHFDLNDSKQPQFVKAVKIADKIIPTDEYGQILVPYIGPAYSFPYISATDVLKSDDLKTDTFVDAIVFVGTSAIGLADLRSTTVGVQYPGVEVHANVFNGIMNPHIVPSEPSWALAYTVLFMLLIGIVLSFILRRKSALNILIIGFSSLILSLGINVYFWSVLKVSVPILMPLLLIIVLMVSYTFMGFLTETKTKRNIQDMFGQYVPPQHIEKLIDSSSNLDLSTEKREMSVLFSDVRGFTSLSESLTPNDLSLFLNEYLSSVTEIIFEHGGTIDKYVGDMVMAFWNAPIDEPNHAEKSIASALALLDNLKIINRVFIEKKWPEVKVGIGISTGDMNVGDMGSQYRKAYTVLGDAVNLGSRIEGLTKYYGVDLLVSELTKQSAQSYSYRLIDIVTVVGKTTAVKIYEPFRTNELSKNQKSDLDLHQQAFDAYRNKDWVLANELFFKLKENNSFSTKVYDIIIARMVQLNIETLPQNWSGEFTHSKK